MLYYWKLIYINFSLVSGDQSLINCVLSSSDPRPTGNICPGTRLTASDHVTSPPALVPAERGVGGVSYDVKVTPAKVGLYLMIECV